MTSLLVIAHVGLWVAVVVQGLAICALLYKNSRLAEAAASGGVAGHDLLGASAPPFQAVDLCTGAVVSYTRFAAKPTILLFLSHACPTCQRLMRGLANARKMDELVGSVRLLAYCEGSAAAYAAYAESVGNLEAITLVGEHDVSVADLFGIRALPSVVKVDSDWRIAAYAYPATWDDVAQLVVTTNGARERS